MPIRVSLLIRRLRPFGSSPLNRHRYESASSILNSNNRFTRTTRPRTTTTTTTTDDLDSTYEIPGIRNQYGSLGEDTPLPKDATAWQAASHFDVQRVTQKAIIYEMIHRQTKTIESVVPWFLENMPASYFATIPERFRVDHMKAVAAVKDADMNLYSNLKAHLSDGREVLTFLRPGTRPGTLLSMVSELPYKFSTEKPLTRLHVFSTADETMSLNMFVYGHRPNKGDGYNDTVSQELKIAKLAAPILDYAAQLKLQQENGDGNGGVGNNIDPSLLERDALLGYLKNCTETYISVGTANPGRFLRQRAMVAEVSGTEGSRVHLSPAVEEQQQQGIGNTAAAATSTKYHWVDYVVANSLPQAALENMSRVLYHYNFDVARARLDVVPDGNNGDVTILRALIAPTKNTDDDTVMRSTENNNAHEFDIRDPEETALDRVQRGLVRSKWLDPETMNLVFGGAHPWLGVRRGEIIIAFCSLVHPVLSKEHAVAFSKANIFDTIKQERFISHAARIADLFLDRFQPNKPLTEEELSERCRDIQATIESDVEDHVATEVLLKMVDVVRHTLKTNVYMPDRYALGLRLDPAIMIPAPHEEGKQQQQKQQQQDRELPYGVLFVHGRRFNSFHVRFRDIARGGMRLVTPPSPELYALESTRHYDECYGLAFAQQLKNKDIPEGGSKAVTLINTSGLNDQGKFFVMRKSVKAFTDAVLDLIVDTAETRANVVDFFGRKEILYLGPDEQVLPQDIEWVVQRAGQRGYDTPAAFMSSKPKAGINHKEFGVTSESVNRYLDAALRHVSNIDPNNESFSVKMTGGPDGDVAGNEIKILIREYGENAKIVGIADHSGCAEDPEGLDHEELLRLYRKNLDISNFDPIKLGSSGVLHTVDTPEGVKARNTMHNRLEADAFIPCGGRPNTIDITNYKNFLKEDGTPSSPLIVEGANLFVTAEARKALSEEAGVVIVKDSSANKGGVITSSFEICAAMLLSEEEFVANKSKIVQEVIDKLRDLADMEAKLLFYEHRNYGGSLHDVSQIVSNAVNTVTDALITALDGLPDKDLEALLPLFRQYLPSTMADLAFDRVHDRVPAQYIKNAISSSLASKIVYKEGATFVAAQQKSHLAALCLKYLEKEKDIVSLMESLETADMPDDEKQSILRLLDAGGTRAALELDWT